MDAHNEFMAEAEARRRCEWCGATGGAQDELCSTLSDRDLLLHYYSGVSRVCNHATWQHRRDLFDRADQIFGKAQAL
jgi:hypothetical protein